MRKSITHSALFLALFLVSTHAHAQDYRTRPALLQGTKAKQWTQYHLAISHEVASVPTDAAVRREIAAGRLVRLNGTSPWYYLDDDLGKGYRNRSLLYHVRPWVQSWLDAFAFRFHNEFETKLKVTSLVRTQERHEQVQRATTSAAREVPSAHLTGAAIDISFRHLTPTQIRWLRREAVHMVQSGQAVVFEELSGGNFHFFILPPPPEPAPPVVILFPLAALMQCMP
jgi:hypothetical protein